MPDGTPTEVSVANLSALQLVQAARAVQIEQDAAEGALATFSVGPLAADLARIDPRLVVQVGDDPAISIANVAGLAWAAAGEAGDRAAALETRVRELERRLAEFL